MVRQSPGTDLMPNSMNQCSLGSLCPASFHQLALGGTGAELGCLADYSALVMSRRGFGQQIVNLLTKCPPEWVDAEVFQKIVKFKEFNKFKKIQNSLPRLLPGAWESQSPTGEPLGAPEPGGPWAPGFPGGAWGGYFEFFEFYKLC